MQRAGQKQRIGITGGGGSIGSVLARVLASRGAEVVCLDVTDRGKLPDVEGVRLELGDVRDPEKVDQLVASASVVFHLASVVGVDTYAGAPLEVLDVGIDGTRNVLLACLRHDVPVFYASSSEVYGKNPLVLDEHADRVLGDYDKLRWTYALAKNVGEAYAVALARQGLRVVIGRYFNVYGPLLDTPGQGRVVSRFLGCLQERRPIKLVRGGRAVRSFCYMDEAVEATLALMDAFLQGRVEPGTAVNIGKEEPVTIRELAELMVHLSGIDVPLVDATGDEVFGAGFEEIEHRVPDVCLLKRLTGFEAKVGLEEGLKRTLEQWGLLCRRDSRAQAG